MRKVDMTQAYRAKNAKRAAHMIREAVLLGDWKEVQGVDAQTIKPELSPGCVYPSILNSIKF